LEQAPKGSVVVLQNQEPTHQAKTAMPEPGQKSATVVVQNQIPAPHAKTTTEPVKTATTTKTEPTVKSTLQALENKIDDLKEAASDKGLELDLDYHYNGHFGASAALVLCGNSSNADYGAPPAIFCGNRQHHGRYCRWLIAAHGMLLSAFVVMPGCFPPAGSASSGANNWPAWPRPPTGCRIC